MIHLYKVLLSTIFIFSLSVSIAQHNPWGTATEKAVASRNSGQQRIIIPKKYHLSTLDTVAMINALRQAPAGLATPISSSFILALPMPGGEIRHFRVSRYQMMEAPLQALFSDILTFEGQGIEDRTAILKMDWTAHGFHAVILSPATGSVWIDPYARGNKTDYISYFKKDLEPRTLLEVGGNFGRPGDPQVENAVPVSGPCLGQTLRTYRLAIACTGEYAVAVGGTTPALLHSAIVTSVNRLNAVYESEVAIRFILVANNNLIEYLTPGGDLFTGNNDATTLIVESQNVITSVIGSANFDIGHTFSTGGGGLASPGVVCNNAAKARGVTGSPQPFGDAYDIDFVAHEIGHQFNGRHSFNALTDNCSGNAVATTNAEPGSGSTIMGYAGICGTNDLQLNSDPQFHAVSFNEIGIFSRNGNGNTCGTATATGNTPPVVNAGADYTIPVNTPFSLTGSATDADGDVLTYSWEQIDVGGGFGNVGTQVGAAPLFRSFPPTFSPTRNFPRSFNAAGNSAVFGENLPTAVRDLNFRLTARDNRVGGGGVCYDQMKVTTSGATAFDVTSQAVPTNWVANGTNTATITWTTAGTTAAPFNVANVTILFSVDGGLSFPYTLLASTPNDGSQDIVIPAQNTNRGRVMVKSIGNIFFDINIANITIASGCVAEGAVVAPAGIVVAEAGDASLNLGLSPQYSVPLNVAGTLQVTDPASTLAAFNTATSGCINFSNQMRYDVYSFIPSISATYTFTLGTGAGTGVVTDLYNGSFDPANPCTNFLRSNITYTAPNAGLLPNISQALVAGNPYTLVIGTFNDVTPALPAAYTVSYASAPAGGQLFTGSSFYPNPGAGFNYAYVIVNTATGNIVAISPTANLTNATTFSGGTYAVYGLSYSTSIANLASFVGGSLTALTNNIFTNPAAFCANFSKNLVTVIISSVVPVDAITLDAQKQGKQVDLKWTTISESNSSHFNVQRSADGIHFNTQLARVNAAGTSTGERNYQLPDVSPLNGINYYRVAEIGLNGSTTFSNTVAVNFTRSNSIFVYPNPAAEELNMEFNTEAEGRVAISVFDSKGARVMKDAAQLVSGRTLRKLNVSSLAPGVYLLRYRMADGQSGHTKFLKK